MRILVFSLLQKTMHASFTYLRSRADVLTGGLIAAAALGVYVMTLCPTVDYIDAGELATVVTTLGIAHPTGYPLFTLLGHLFVMLPLGMRVITQANLFSAVVSAAALVIFFRLLVLVLGRMGRPAGSAAVLTAAAAGTLLLAFSETFWSQALSVEVYPLHGLFLVLLLTLAARALLEPGVRRPVAADWMLFAYCLGLAFTNHMTTILLAPAMLVAFFRAYGFRSRSAWRTVGWMALPFVLGLSVYLYLPVRSAADPVMNWGQPVDLERLWWHFTGKVYRVWIFSSFDSAGKQFSYFLGALPGEFGLAALPVVLYGAWAAFRQHRGIFLVSLLLFASCVGYAINYDIHDIDSYFLLAYIVMAAWAAAGVKALLDQLRAAAGRRAVAAGALAVGAACCAVNYGKVDQSGNVAVERYTRDVFRSLPPDALVLSYQWDYFVSAAYYLQVVEGYRTDVAVVDKELLRRTWYLHALGVRYPSLLAPAQAPLRAFGEQLRRFEHDLPYNPAVIERSYAELIRALLGARPDAFVTPEIEAQYTQGMERFPVGVVFALKEGVAADSASWVLENVPPFGAADKYGQGIETMYLHAVVNQGVHSLLKGDTAAAHQFAQKAFKMSPDDESVRMLLTRLGVTR